MADTLTINVRDIRYSDKVHVRIPVIGQTNPCSNYDATEDQIRQLMSIPNYEIRDAASGVIINGHNLQEYFPSGGGGGGGGGTTNYNELSNRPQINNKTLAGNKSSSDLGLQAKLTTTQQKAVDSGIDNTKVGQIATNTANISNLDTNKVDKVAGKSLSTNDFTDEYKTQIGTNSSDISDLQTQVGYANTELEGVL